MTEKEVGKFIEQIIESDKSIIDNNDVGGEKVLPLIALRGKVFFPKTLLNFDVGRVASISAVEQAVKDNSEIFITSQRRAQIEAPKMDDICKVGVIARIKQVIKIQNTGNMKVSVEALCRARVKELISAKGHFTVLVEERPYIAPEEGVETEAFLRVAKKAFYEFASTDKRISKEMITTINFSDCSI